MTAFGSASAPAGRIGPAPRPRLVRLSRFDISTHVLATEIDRPGTDAEILQAASRLSATLLDRAMPLWELWFLTGLNENRVGV